MSHFTSQWYQDYLIRSGAIDVRSGAATVGSAPVESKEKKLHEAIIRECRRRGWTYIHSRMDRKSTTACGVPDFVILADRGRTFYVECKTQSKLTTEQMAFIAWAGKLGHTVAVVRSLREFVQLVG